MKLRNRKTYMNTLPEGAPPENVRPRITQIIYYLILLTVIGYVVYIFGSRYFYFKEQGYVEVEKTVISSSRGGKLLKLKVQEGQKIEKNTLLAVIEAVRQCQSSEYFPDNSRVQKLAYDIAMNRARQTLLNNEIKTHKKGLSTFSLHRALETGQKKQLERYNLKLLLEKKQSEADLLYRQIILQQRQLAGLKKQALSVRLPADCYNEVIKAPFSGKVQSIKRKVNEFSARGSALLGLIADNADVRIELYLDNDQLRYLHAGDHVDIKFSDGVKSQAKIKTIYSSAYKFPERDWVHYRPADTQVRVDLVPVNRKDAVLWMRYDRMEVTVRGRK